jgi:hypothetical protein
MGPYSNIKVITAPGGARTPAHEKLELEARDLLIGGADLWGQQSWKCVEY